MDGYVPIIIMYSIHHTLCIYLLIAGTKFSDFSEKHQIR